MSLILPDSFQNDLLKSRVTLYFKQAKIRSFLHQSNIRKVITCPYPIFSLVLQGKNLYRTLESGRFPDAPEKYAVYDLLKRTTYNWRNLLSDVGLHLIKTILLRFAEVFLIRMGLLGNMLAEEAILTDDQIEPFFNKFMNNLPKRVRESFLLPVAS